MRGSISKFICHSLKFRAFIHALHAPCLCIRDRLDSPGGGHVVVTGGKVTGGHVVAGGLVVTGGQVGTGGRVVTGGQVVMGGLVVAGREERRPGLSAAEQAQSYKSLSL